MLTRHFDEFFVCCFGSRSSPWIRVRSVALNISKLRRQEPSVCLLNWTLAAHIDVVSSIRLLKGNYLVDGIRYLYFMSAGRFLDASESGPNKPLLQK